MPTSWPLTSRIGPPRNCSGTGIEISRTLPTDGTSTARRNVPSAMTSWPDSLEPRANSRASGVRLSMEPIGRAWTLLFSLIRAMSKALSTPSRPSILTFLPLMLRPSMSKAWETT